MIKILVVVPYDELYDEVRGYLASVDTSGFDIELKHLYGSEGLVIQQCDADIVVARGITGKAFARLNPSIHYIEIAISGGDLVTALWNCKRCYGDRDVGVIVTDANICDPEQLRDLTGIPIHLRMAANEKELYAAIDELAGKGIDTFIGGLTLCRHCDDMGYRYIHIKSGREAVTRALGEALAAARSLNRERTRTNLITTVLNNAEDVMFAANRDGVVIASNTQASSLFFGTAGTAPEGRRLDEVLPAELHDLVPGGPDRIAKIGDQLVLVKATPILVGDERSGLLVTCRSVEALRETEQKIRKELSKKGLVAHYSFNDILCASPSMKSLLHNAYKYSQVDSGVLIIGETGTGKELFAQSIHNASKRSAHPFVAVNCAALPEQLLESELFGYVEGAFSGAAKGGRIGLFELAHKGTLFLDEIGELPLNLQAKILRVLQEKEIRKIGGDAVLPVDVRIISATNIDMTERLRDGSFRGDLYYRINLLNIRIPPLRLRREDIGLIFRHFVSRFSRQQGKPEPAIEASLEDYLSALPWRGNIRELRNFAERLVILNEKPRIGRDDIDVGALLDDWDSERDSRMQPMLSGSDSPEPVAGRMSLRARFESSGLDHAAFAASMGISRTTLWRRLKADTDARVG